MIKFIPATNNSDYRLISKLAKDIWTEHYTPIIGVAQVNYMLEKFQSEKAITDQSLINNYKYFTIYNQSDAIGYLSIKTDFS